MIGERIRTNGSLICKVFARRVYRYHFPPGNVLCESRVPLPASLVAAICPRLFRKVRVNAESQNAVQKHGTLEGHAGHGGSTGTLKGTPKQKLRPYNSLLRIRTGVCEISR